MDDLEIETISRFGEGILLEPVKIDRDKFYRVCKEINAEISTKAAEEICLTAENCLTYYKKMAEDEREKSQNIVKRKSNKNFEDIELLLGKLIPIINEIHNGNSYALSRLLSAATTCFSEHIGKEDFDNSAVLPMYENIIQSLLVIKEIAELAKVDIPRHAPKKFATAFLAEQTIALYKKLSCRADRACREKQKTFLCGLLESANFSTPVKLNSIMREIDEINGKSRKRISKTSKASAEQKIKRRLLTSKWK